MKLTDEEKRSKHNAYQKEYQRKLYQSNEEHRKKRINQILNNYALITPEEKERRNNYSKLYYQKKKLEKDQILKEPLF